MFPNLRAEMARGKHSAASMAPKMGMNERTLANKIAGKTDFTWKEASKLRAIFFPAFTLEFLLEVDDEKNTA
jgi:plasmid maintenance system antidote protein VapI